MESMVTPKEIYAHLIKDGRFKFTMKITGNMKVVFLTCTYAPLNIKLGKYDITLPLDDILEDCAERALAITGLKFEELRGE
jgi:hypothetical protein